MGRTKEKIDEKKLRSWKLLDDFRRRLAKARTATGPPPDGRPGGPERLLLEEDYFSLMLFGLLNPVIDSMRGPLAHAFPPRQVGIGDLLSAHAEEGLPLRESFLLLFHVVEDLLQERHRPLAIIEFVRASRVPHVERQSCFGILPIERQVLRQSTAFLGMIPPPLIGHVVLHRRQQEGAEATPLAIGEAQRVTGHQPLEESLHQIFRIVHTLPVAPEIPVKRPPVDPEKVAERLVRGGLIAPADDLANQGPAGGHESRLWMMLHEILRRRLFGARYEFQQEMAELRDGRIRSLASPPWRRLAATPGAMVPAGFRSREPGGGPGPR